MKQALIYITVLLAGFSSYAQSTLDSLQQLDEIVVKTDTYLKTFSNTQSVSTLKDSVLVRSASSLTDVLNLNSFVYFKENGLGMVSSAAFRGTTAQQTAVVWNGININSQFNGQTDFNTINIRNFDEIDVRSGGGSVLYGSGAIGGSIHLNNVLHFDEGFNNSLLARYGSFETVDVAYQSGYSNDRISVNAVLSRTSSENDYDFVDSEKSNLNGEFYNTSFSATIGYKLSYRSFLKFYSYVFDGDRHFSLQNPTETPTKYKDFNTRDMLEWDVFFGSFRSNVKLAYITERFKYFGNIASDSYTFGEAKSLIGKYQLGYKIAKETYLQGVLDVTHTNGEGSSIHENERTITGGSLLWKQAIKKFFYEATIRKEVTQNYDSPLLFSLGLQYKFNKVYTLNLNASKNYRIPTYNDLFWAGSANPNLNPETSYQFEIGNDISFKNGTFSLVGFYNDITDMIRWLPNGSNWKPSNTDHVLTYGLESSLEYQRSFKEHEMSLNVGYAYTKSEDQATKKQLTYVPYHKAFGGLGYHYKRLNAYWQSVFTGEVFMLSDNNPRYVLDRYWLHNAGVEYGLGKAPSWTMGIQIKNILNKNYQSVANRYMPGTNYNLYLNFNF
ncbi:TonB-dependent siderophore receptor [Mangrovimonas sp. YM274]|uniref:TonB-dependent receptor plug domain-containing protein n=1 Tax=Mangrovimonas sp. YM274 TaxID=3070660 RepID=UPI0027DB08F5|nr:TonB-dependent receptor [Mangrovimonas sp. YM274]WMI69953.1 TonB-dependent receptor [Mangrovimonas sp. YM274]